MKSKRKYLCTKCMAPCRPKIDIIEDVEIYTCETCCHCVAKHWVEDLDENVFKVPILFTGSKEQAEDFLEDIEDNEKQRVIQALGGNPGEDDKSRESSERDIYSISRVTGTDLYSVFYNTSLRAKHRVSEGERLIMELGKELLEIEDTLNSREDFFNYEAKRVSDMEEEEVTERIKKYGDILFSARVFQNANMIRLKEIIASKRKEFDLESLKPEKKATKRASSGGKDPLETAARQLMKIMPAQLPTLEDAIAYINKGKGASAEKSKE